MDYARALSVSLKTAHEATHTHTHVRTNCMCPWHKERELQHTKARKKIPACAPHGMWIKYKYVVRLWTGVVYFAYECALSVCLITGRIIHVRTLGVRAADSLSRVGVIDFTHSHTHTHNRADATPRTGAPQN